jgi:hypothetical protein
MQMTLLHGACSPASMTADNGELLCIPARLGGLAGGIHLDLFILTCDRLPPGMRVTQFSGVEGLSRLYRFTLDVVIPGDQGLVLDLSETLDSFAALTTRGTAVESYSTFHGIIASR